jgi:hypothetical protein
MELVIVGGCKVDVAHGFDPAPPGFEPTIDGSFIPSFFICSMSAGL